MKFVLVDYVTFTCQIQDMTDMKEVWKLRIYIRILDR